MKLFIVPFFNRQGCINVEEESMSLTLKTKLVLAFLLAIILSIGSVSAIVFFQVNDYSRETFEETSISQLHRIDEFITEFISEGMDNAQYLAAIKSSKKASGQLNRFFGPDGIKTIDPRVMSPTELDLFHTFESLVQTHPTYAAVFLGSSRGGFVMYPPDTMPDGYDPRQRPWYKETQASSKKAVLSKAYMSTTGEPVSSIMARIKSPSGQVTSIVGIDINLGTLTKVTSNIKLGRTGYVMLLEGDGTILSDPRHVDLNFKKAQETDLLGLQAIAKAETGTFETEIDGVKKLVSVLGSEATGWKLAYIMDSDEVFEASNSMLTSVLLTGTGLGVLLLLGAWLLALSFVRPINLLVTSSEAVAEGDFEALPESRFFSGELLTLHASLKKMVGELVNFISTAETKTKEAEEKSAQAEKAMQEAEQAKEQAVIAKRDGMFQAAQALEEIVEQVTSASQELSAQIEEASQGSAIQRDRTAEAATAMEQMNASVLEVASNASQAAESADEARQEAENGGEIVNNVVSSINQVDTKASAMSHSLDNLGKQAEGIGRIMTVITDIADQTNLLALNAAIEAARAGDAGRGFAVVADEVRKLAEKTMTATKEVGDSVAAIQQGTNTAIADMGEAAQMVNQSTEYAQQAGGALQSILGIVDSTADQVRAIATASEEQSAASEQINRNTEEVNRIASETAESMLQSAQAVSDLARLTEDLNMLIEKLKEED
jgi:methyl-accepting chemotaxis protein